MLGRIRRNLFAKACLHRSFHQFGRTFTTSFGNIRHLAETYEAAIDDRSRVLAQACDYAVTVIIVHDGREMRTADHKAGHRAIGVLLIAGLDAGAFERSSHDARG
jgi:hypothetical protein